MSAFFENNADRILYNTAYEFAIKLGNSKQQAHKEGLKHIEYVRATNEPDFLIEIYNRQPLNNSFF